MLEQDAQKGNEIDPGLDLWILGKPILLYFQFSYLDDDYLVVSDVQIIIWILKPNYYIILRKFLLDGMQFKKNPALLLF